MAAFAREWKQIFISTVNATDTCKAIVKIPAAQVFPDHPRIVSPPEPITLQVAFFPDTLKRLEVIFYKLEVGAFAGVSLYIGMTVHTL